MPYSTILDVTILYYTRLLYTILLFDHTMLSCTILSNTTLYYAHSICISDMEMWRCPGGNVHGVIGKLSPALMRASQLRRRGQTNAILCGK